MCARSLVGHLTVSRSLVGHLTVSHSSRTYAIVKLPNEWVRNVGSTPTHTYDFGNLSSRSVHLFQNGDLLQH